jgi:hypothetical protein
MMVTAALRAIDGAAGVLQRLRNSLAPPSGTDVSSGDGGGRGQTLDERTPPTVAQRSRGLLYYSIVALVCVLLGGATGMLITYRGMSKLHQASELQIERLKDEIAQSRTDAARAAKVESKLQLSIFGMRKELRDAREEAADYKRQIDELKQQPPAAKRIERVERPSASANRSSPMPAGPKSGAKSDPQPKSGTCSAGAGSTTEDLINCIKKLNNP